MASIEKGEGGKYRIRWRTLRGRARQHTVSSQRLAKECIRHIEEAHDRGQEWDPRRLRAAPSLADASRAHLVDRRRRWKASTVEVRALTLSTFLVWLAGSDDAERVAGMYPEDLTRQRVAEYWDHLVHERGLARSTANDRVGHVQQWWDWCRDHDEWGEHFPRVRRLDLPTVPRERRTAPTWAQMDAAIHAGWESRAPWYGDMFLVERCTGLRVSQVLRLEWRDVDLERATLRIRGELGKTTQEQAGRLVPMAPVLVEILAGWGRRTGPLVVRPIRESDGRPQEPSRKTLPKLWARTSADPEVYRQPNHTFRRGFVTGLAALGVGDEVRKALVGHSRGVHGVYTDDEIGLWDAMVEAVAKVPRVAGARGEVIRFRGSGEEG